MSWRMTGILFIILLVLGGVVFWQRRSGGEADATPTEIAPAPTRPLLFGGTGVDEVARLDLRKNDEAASLSHESSGEWFMTVPTATQLISATVTSNVQTLLDASSRRTLSPDANPLTAYGLEEPATEITVAARRGEEIRRQTLFVGDQTPGGDAYYVRKQGDPRVHIIPTFSLDGVLDLISNPPLLTPVTTTLPFTPTLPITATVSPED